MAERHFEVRVGCCSALSSDQATASAAWVSATSVSSSDMMSSLQLQTGAVAGLRSAVLGACPNRNHRRHAVPPAERLRVALRALGVTKFDVGVEVLAHFLNDLVHVARLQSDCVDCYFESDHPKDLPLQV